MQRLLLTIVLVATAVSVGCHDGPLYALKTINPYYLSEWSEDQQLGPTDYQRQEELENVAVRMASMSDADQKYWIGELKKVVEHDKNPQMRSVAVRAAGGYRGDEFFDFCGKTLSDESVKVRMVTCDVLGRRDDPRSTNLLAETVGGEENADVKMAAIRALGKHQSKEAQMALKTDLDSRDPAVRVACIESLRNSSGQDFGDDPKVWVAYLNGEQVAPRDSSVADRVLGLF